MNRKLPPRVEGLAHLVELAAARRSVYFPGLPGIGTTPAAWALQWSGERLHKLFVDGMYVYEPHMPNKLSRWGTKR